MAEVKRPSLIKPNATTLFHIDFKWWQETDSDWHVHLRSMLCAEHQNTFAEIDSGQSFDYIDPITAEVRPMDALQQILMTHCAQQEDFLTSHTAMVDAIFRTFLVDGNKPMTASELGERLSRPADTILKTISGARVYRGIRPVLK